MEKTLERTGERRKTIIITEWLIEVGRYCLKKRAEKQTTFNPFRNPRIDRRCK